MYCGPYRRTIYFRTKIILQVTYKFILGDSRLGLCLPLHTLAIFNRSDAGPLWRTNADPETQLVPQMPYQLSCKLVLILLLCKMLLRLWHKQFQYIILI